MANIIIRNLKQLVCFIILIIFFKLNLINIGRNRLKKRNKRQKMLAI